MPPVIIGAVVAAGAYAAGAVLMTAIAIGLAAAAVYSVATMKKPTTPGTDPQSAKQMIRSSNQPYRGIFGSVHTSGPIIFAEEYSNPSTVTENYTICNSVPGGTRQCQTYARTVESGKKWLHLVVVLAGHPVDSIPEVYFGDTKQTNWDHDYWKINVMDGSQTSISQIPPALRAVPSWTDTMIGRGLAWVHVMIRHSAEHFPNGIPNIKCKVNGTRVKTPFYNGFTSNAAAVIYHYLRYHFGATEKMINTESFANEYALCNEGMPAEINTGLAFTPIRYAIDGGFDYDESHENVLAKMKSACGGDLIFTNGQYYLQVAAYRGPIGSKQVISLSDLNGSIDILPDTNLNDRINTVKGTHVSALHDYQPVDFPKVSNPEYVAQDGGEERAYDADFEYVLNPHQAHRLANIILKDNRFGLTITAPLNMRGFKFNVGLPVGFDDKSLGYDKLEFRVVSWKVKPGSGVTLVIKQTAPEIYDDSLATVKPKPPEIGVPDPKFTPPVTHLNYVDLSDDNVYDGLITWSHPDLNSIREFEVLYASEPGNDTKKERTTDTMLRLSNMQGVEYFVMVTAYNKFGAPSQPVSLNARIGAPKAITSVIFKPDNFSIVINPVVSGTLPINTSFLFYRASRGVTADDFAQAEYIGTGKTFVDTGLTPNRYYKYFIQVANSAAITDAFGPYTSKTTDDPKDILDIIGPSIPGTFTWTVYATDAFGSGISATYNPAIHTYEGRAYNKSVETPSLNPLDYAFFRIGEFIHPDDQAILDNLAKGKMPDGSGDLVSEDDVLFKKGDHVEETNIADNSISTPKLQANAVVADKIAANAITTPKLDAGAITAEKLAAESVTSDKIVANAITAPKIAAGAISAEKIAVTVVEPINNWSQWNNTRGWSIPDGKGQLVESIPLNGRIARTLKLVSSSTLATYCSADAFTIDHNAIYELRVSVYSADDPSEQTVVFGGYGTNFNGGLTDITRVHPVTLKDDIDTDSPVYWEGKPSQGWRHMVGYLIGSGVDPESCPKSANVNWILKAGADVSKFQMYVGMGIASGNVGEVHLYSPGGTKLGSGLIVANEIRANTLITSPRIEGGTITGGALTGGTITGGTITGTTYNNGNGTFEVDKDGNVIAKSISAKGKIEADSGYFAGEIRGGSGWFAGTIRANKIIGDIVSGKSVYYGEQAYDLPAYDYARNWTTVASASVKNSTSGKARVLYCNGVSLRCEYGSQSGGRIVGFDWRIVVNGVQKAFGRVIMPATDYGTYYGYHGNAVAIGGGDIWAGTGTIEVQVKIYGYDCKITRNAQNTVFSLITNGSEFN